MAHRQGSGSLFPRGVPLRYRQHVVSDAGRIRPQSLRMFRMDHHQTIPTPSPVQSLRLIMHLQLPAIPFELNRS